MSGIVMRQCYNQMTIRTAVEPTLRSVATRAGKSLALRQG
jgi:hypothetical protein